MVINTASAECSSCGHALHSCIHSPCFTLTVYKYHLCRLCLIWACITFLYITFSMFNLLFINTASADCSSCGHALNSCIHSPCFTLTVYKYRLCRLCLMWACIASMHTFSMFYFLFIKTASTDCCLCGHVLHLCIHSPCFTYNLLLPPLQIVPHVGMYCIYAYVLQVSHPVYTYRLCRLSLIWACIASMHTFSMFHSLFINTASANCPSCRHALHS
jgi:hypothetical protein